MSRSRIRLLALVLLLPASLPLRAETPIERLIQETGIEAGPVAMRGRPGWHTPDRIILRFADDFIAELQASYPGIEFVDAADEDAAIAAAPGAEAIIGFCSERLLAAARDAVWVQIFSAGAERCVPVPQVTSGKVVLTNMQKMSSPVLAEHAVAMMLSLARGLVVYGKMMPDGEWVDDGPAAPRQQEVGGQTVLVVGLGGIGTEVARRAAALGMRVTGTRRSSHEGPDFVAYVGLSDELYTLAGEADFIVNALPLTPETTGLFDKRFFAAARQGAYFISIGRGASTVTDDLLAALDSGHIAGAGLDVTEPEPLPAGHPLWQRRNVIITPHVAGRGGSRDRHVLLLRENIRRFVAGEALLNVVDPKLGY
jgi:phosphoglycerate dehydrogenase-like enzyme